MYKFSKKSKGKLATCDYRLQRVFHEVIKHRDCTIIEGHRTPERQNKLFKDGKSKIDGIKKKGNHNYSPSRAVDVAPYPIDWSDTKRFYDFGEFVLKTAKELGIKLRWGGDWDGDGDYKDQTFNDLVHFELHKSEK